VRSRRDRLEHRDCTVSGHGSGRGYPQPAERDGCRPTRVPNAWRETGRPPRASASRVEAGLPMPSVPKKDVPASGPIWLEHRDCGLLGGTDRARITVAPRDKIGLNIGIAADSRRGKGRAIGAPLTARRSSRSWVAQGRQVGRAKGDLVGPEGVVESSEGSTHRSSWPATVRINVACGPSRGKSWS
jgi:hypothetical protein